MTPTAKDVEITIQQLECDEHEAIALRRFYERERAQRKVSPFWRVLWISGTALAVVWVAWVLAAAVIDWLLSGLGAR